MPSPPQLANLVCWYKADTGVFQDTGGTTPVTTTGQAVALWQDQSGNSNHQVAISGHAPTYTTGALNGLPSVTFARSSTQRMATASTVTLGITTANWWTAMVYITPAAWVTSGGTLAFGSYAPAIYIPSETGTRCVDIYTSSDHNFADILTLNTAYLTEVTCTSGTIKAYHAQVGTSPAADANTFTGASIANAKVGVGYDGGTGASSFQGQLCELLIYNTALNSTDQASLESYLSSRYAPAPTFAPWIFNSDDC
jgi:hypothetical protein